MLSYILWDGNANLLSWGPFTLRWDGLLLIIAFVAARQLLVSIYKREGKPTKDVETLAIYFIIASFLGARLGHALFFQPQLLAKPLALFFPFEFKPRFHFTGLTGFSSHGAVLGILVASWLYSRKKKPGQGFLQVLDRTTLVTLWIGILLLVGSFLNSSIEGKTSNGPLGTVMISPVISGLLQLPCCVMRSPGGKNPLRQVVAKKEKDNGPQNDGYHAIALYFFFKPGTPEQIADEFMVGDVKTFLYEKSTLVHETGTEPLHYVIFEQADGVSEVRVRTTGVARHPVQLFEAGTSLLLFGFLLFYWGRHKSALSAGMIFGIGMIAFWSFRFAFEFLKMDQSSYIKNTVLNKAQVASVPLILIGVVVLINSRRELASNKSVIRKK